MARCSLATAYSAGIIDYGILEEARSTYIPILLSLGVKKPNTYDFNEPCSRSY